MQKESFPQILRSIADAWGRPFALRGEHPVSAEKSLLMRVVLVALAVLLVGCVTPGPETFATFMHNGESHTYAPAVYSRAGDDTFLEAQGMKVVSGPSGVSGTVDLKGKSLKIARGTLTLQSLKDKTAQGNLELILESNPPIEVRGSFKARTE